MIIPFLPKKNKKTSKLLFLHIFFLIFVLTIGIFILKKTKKPSLKTTYNTNNWLEYKNENYGFQLKYPSDWKIEEKSEGEPSMGYALAIKWETKTPVILELEANPRSLENVLSHMVGPNSVQKEIISNNKYYVIGKSTDPDNNYYDWTYITGKENTNYESYWPATLMFDIKFPQEIRREWWDEIKDMLSTVKLLEK